MDIFKTPAGSTSLPLAEERALIASAKTVGGSAWALLVQYRGLLQSVAFDIRKRARGLTAEQIEDLQQDLILTALEVIRDFDLATHIRLSQVLPAALRRKSLELTTALVIPAGTLARWFAVWREADQDHQLAADLAPKRGMTTETYLAIQHALEFADSEWTTLPYNGGSRPTADAETYRLAHLAMEILTPAERDVIEQAFGFRGDPKPDDEVALVLDSTKGTVKSQRKRALTKMRLSLTKERVGESDRAAGVIA